MGVPAFDYMLALHTNPESLSEKMTKSKNVAMTYGGFVEWLWPDELDIISASHTTGGFLGPNGLVSGTDTLDAALGDADRKNTIAWERKEDLIEVFRNNGLIYDGFGQPVLRGTVEMIYDRGIFRGYFTNFQETESADKPFSFQLDWEFKVEQTIYKFPPFRSNEKESELFNRRPGGREIGSPTDQGVIVSNRQTKFGLVNGLQRNNPYSKGPNSEGVLNYDENDNIVSGTGTVITENPAPQNQAVGPLTATGTDVEFINDIEEP
jgi:hypothetical protein